MTSEVPSDILLNAMTTTTEPAASTSICFHEAPLKPQGSGAPLTKTTVHSEEEDGVNSADFMSCEKTASMSFDDNKTLEEDVSSSSSSSSSSHVGEDGGNDQQHSSVFPSSIFRSSPAPAQRASLAYLESSPFHRYKAHHNDDGDDDKADGAENLLRKNNDDSKHNNTASTGNSGSGVFSPLQQTSLAAYKTTVHQVMQRMEQSQIRLLERQDAKSRAFRRRVDELLMYGGVNGCGSSGGSGGGGDGDGGEKNIPCDGNATIATAVSTLHRQDDLAASGSHGSSSDVGTDQGECYHSKQSDDDPHHPPSVVIGDLPFVGEDPPATSLSSSSRQKQSTLEPTATSIVPPTSSSLSSSYTSIFHLQKEVQKLRTGFADLQVENDALRALRSSYQNRLAREADHRETLERQVTQLQDKVEEWHDKYQSQDDLVKLLKNQCREQRMVTLSQETTLQHKNQRVRRDLDKLWKKYKTSQKQNEISQQIVIGMEEKLKQLERKEVKWQKERGFMKEKMQFMKDKTTKLNKSLQESKEAQNKVEEELTKLKFQEK